MAEQDKSAKHPWGKRRYKSVLDGCAMAAQFRRSGLTIGEFVRQTGVSRRMVLYWTQRERELASSVQEGFVEVTPAIESDSSSVNATPLLETAREPTCPTSSSPPEPSSPPSVMVGTSSLEITLPRGVTIKVGPAFDPAIFRAVVSCLESSPC